MWISGQIADNSRKNSEISKGSVVKITPEGVTVKSGEEYKDIPLISPSGMKYVPTEGEEVAVFPMEDGAVCSPMYVKDNELDVGELMLKVPSGAYIWLRNNGQVVINGQVIEKEEN